MSITRGLLWRSVPLCACSILLAARVAPAADPSPASDDQGSIEYQLRASEDPSKVAKMFHVTLDELLALNHITDPRRLTVGTTLKIPDPRASMVKQLSAEKHGLETQ